ncbi:unnamed protein product [Blepharisma stoltei]|uniref:Dickkopf N-terminal cysteine-rich domain-containing protein n=1 Tax=Blepharisma stoltei TaxID=1481888 RepID=A0AAU9JX83_9CILI|nr:unnamed protein product [Blepharisma stoltei]
MLFLYFSYLFSSFISVSCQDFNSTNDASLNCGSFACRLSNQTFTSNTCSFYASTQNAYYIKKCSTIALNYCLFSSQQNSTCIGDQPPITSFAWPGEKCADSSDCNSHAKHGCIGGICVGAYLNEYCKTSDDCDPGLRCVNNTCQKQIPVGGSGCSTDYDCVNHAGCNTGTSLQNSYCVSYYSIGDHMPVGACSKTNVGALCDSGSCMLNNGAYECMKSVKSTTFPKTCTSNSDCLSVPDSYFPNNGQLQGTCTCTYGKTGASYCSIFPGDSYAADKTKYLKIWIQSDFIDKCNTNRRFNMKCMSDWWGKSSYNNYVYNYMAAFDYPLYTNADNCVVETLLPDYYQAKKNIGK